MQQLKDLKIGTQLRIGFGVILVLILLLGAISWRQSDRIAKQTMDLYNHPLKVRRALGELKANVLEMRWELMNMRLTTDENKRQNSLQKIDLYELDSEHKLDTISMSYLGPKSDVEAARQAFQGWVSAMKGYSDLVMAGKSNAELIHFDQMVEMDKKIERVIFSVETISQFAYNKGNLIYTASVDLKKSLDIQLLVTINVILALSFLIITILLRNIQQPVNELTRVTKLFGKGKMETRSTYNSLNEFGTLSDSFNKLAESLSHEFAFRDHFAQLNAYMLKALESGSSMRHVLEPLMKQTNTQVGAIYLLNETKTEFELIESIGLTASAKKSFAASNFEGVMGIALSSKKIEHITNIPAETDLYLATVNGKIRPKEIITIPLLDKKEVIALISLSSLQGHGDVAERTVREIYGPLTNWIHVIIASRRIQKMGESLKHQNAELEAQKHELEAQSNELLEQNTELEMQKKQLNESNQLKTNFLSNMSHELRTPLNSVIALSGVLGRRLAAKIPEEEYSYLNVIERNGKQLLSLINDILDLSRIEAGYEEINLNKFNVNTLVQEVVDLIEQQAIEKNIALTFVENAEIPVVQSDYEKCRHIIQNILANAIKFTSEGEVNIRTKADNQFAYVVIKDTGIGIDKEFLTQIFEEFRQADNSNSRKYGGTGLGLSIAKKYALLIGGNITVESKKGKGSVFTLMLPIHPPANHDRNENASSYPIHQPISRHEVANEAQIEGKNILLVEDSEAAIVQMKEMLSSQGYQISVAHNGNEAFEQIALKIPDAMILDLMMPEVDGFEVLKRIREKEETSHLPVIILTAKYVTREELSFLKHNHVQQLIQKGDINKKQLLDIVTRMIFLKPEDTESKEEKQEPIQRTGTPVILVVEDNPDNMMTIKALLEGYGQVLEAMDGISGIELALLHQPSLILMDIALPLMNGIETLKEMRKSEFLRDIPIVAVSASAMKGDREHFISCGFNDYISKPIDHQIFNQVIINTLGQKNTLL